MRNLLAGQNLRQLFGAARGVLGWDNAQADIVAAVEDGAQHRNSLWLVIFNANQHFARLQNMGKNADPFHDLRGAVLHQTIVGGDVGFTFCCIDDQSLNFIAAAVQFDAGREPCAAQAGNAELMNTLDKRFAAPVAVVAPAVTVYPAVFSVGFNNDAQFGERRGVCNGMGGDRHHCTGRRSVDRQHTSATER